MQIQATDIIATVQSMSDPQQACHLMRFFKTSPGQYGEDDQFLGIKVPHIRLVVKEARHHVALDQIAVLLHSPWHEVRLCGFLLLVEEMRVALPKSRQAPTTGATRRQEIAYFYLRHTRCANNWDLVDMSCPKILGNWLIYPSPDGTPPDRQILYHLAQSRNLWEQRISIVTCWMLIRANQYDDALTISTMLLSHPHDLIHKAVGWMLREVGKRDMSVLQAYLTIHVSQMHRTTLRYAIEKMSPIERKYWMTR